MESFLPFLIKITPSSLKSAVVNVLSIAVTFSPLTETLFWFTKVLASLLDFASFVSTKIVKISIPCSNSAFAYVVVGISPEIPPLANIFLAASNAF